MSTLSSTSLSDMTPQGEDSHGEDDLRPSLSSDGVTAADDAGSKYIVAKLKELYRSHVVDAERRYNLHFNFALPTDGEIKVCKRARDVKHAVTWRLTLSTCQRTRSSTQTHWFS